MHTDPSVVLCIMLSRALRLLLASERSLSRLPTCTSIFFLFFLESVYFSVDFILRCVTGLHVNYIIVYRYCLLYTSPSPRD